MKEGKRMPTTIRTTVTVNYGLDWMEAIRAGKFYNVYPDEIFRGLQLNRAEQELGAAGAVLQVDFSLHVFQWDEGGSAEVDLFIERQGQRSAGQLELLAMGTAHPLLQIQQMVVARGAVSVDGKWVLALDSFEGERDLRLAPLTWQKPPYRGTPIGFLAVDIRQPQ